MTNGVPSIRKCKNQHHSLFKFNINPFCQFKNKITLIILYTQYGDGDSTIEWLHKTIDNPAFKMSYFCPKRCQSKIMGYQIEIKKHTKVIKRYLFSLIATIVQTCTKIIQRINTLHEVHNNIMCTNILKGFNDLAVNQQMWEEFITFLQKDHPFHIDWLNGV